MITVLLAAAAYMGLFVLIELMVRRFSLNKEVSRKVAHILAGTSAAFLPFVMSFEQIIILSLLFLPVMVISKRRNLFRSIHEVKRKTSGEVYFPLAILLCALLFPDRHLFMYGVLVMSLSDGLASVIGQKFGQKKYKLWQGEKSYLGSVVFFVISLVIGLSVSTSPLWVVTISALVLTFVEASLSMGLDNLALPPLAGSLIFAASKFLQS